MPHHTLHIRNMVCPRCIKVVTEELERLQQPVLQVQLGEVLLAQEPDAQELAQIRSALAANGFELLDDQKAGLVEKVKVEVIKLIRSGQIEHLHVNISTYLAGLTGRDYNYLNTLFAAEEGTTIAKYVVLQKVERVKELLAYNELSLSEISHKLAYSSVAHLSNQFKQVTGITPSEFRKNAPQPRKPLDQVL